MYGAMARILVIDDDGLTRDILKEILSLLGHDIVEAGDGKEGVGRYSEAPTDLVITDIVMPEEDGLETIQEIYEMNPQAKVIAMTGFDGDGEMGYLALAEKLGASLTLKKPLHRDDIVSAVETALAH